jgi:Zn-dependent M28 family amino/carboxypeptidase
MLNFDMAGRLDRPIIVGDDELTATILDILAKGPDQPFEAGRFPSFASSDHVSFTAVGVPAVTITSGDDPGFIHTPQDTTTHVDRESLTLTLGVGDTVLQSLLRTLPPPPR